MKRYIVYVLTLFTLLTACNDREDYSSDPSHRLQFSLDTLQLDTLLTNVSTSTRQLKIYNRHKKALLISSITLADAGKSGFRINVDGMKGSHFTNIELAAQDSLYIFVEATFPLQHHSALALMKDSILFNLNGVRQEIKLRAYAQDAIVLRGKVIEHDTLISSECPLLIYDSLSIAPDAQLTLAAGTHLYFHNKAVMQVHGQLVVEGSQEQPVVFRGDRTDRLFPYLPYDRLPGQWGGIRFFQESFGSVIRYAHIHGGNFGIRCDSSTTERCKLTLQHSVIRQVLDNGLEFTHCQTIVGNSEISNAGNHCVHLLGGHHTFVHCTLANYFSWNMRKGKTLSMANEYRNMPYPLTAAIFRNCLVAGTGIDEVSGQQAKNESIAYNYHFSHCLINSKEMQNKDIVNVRWEKDDYFLLLDSRSQEYDFRLDSSSQAIDLGQVADAQSYPLDRNGLSRLQDKAPDAGCYERKAPL